MTVTTIAGGFHGGVASSAVLLGLAGLAAFFWRRCHAPEAEPVPVRAVRRNGTGGSPRS
ncbi:MULTISPECIES: hypothetical protein [unclassified Methylobacterium]|uniref:hypothetical protein n=1 Tax=unclassified Methylobacterium TaxID=2615210 RepID=UPI000A4998DA|nr:MULTISPECIES: hypothetical protein [unclassified Methylobacterium]